MTRSILGMATATGSHLWTLSGRLKRMPMRKTTKSPSMSAVNRPACTVMSGSHPSHGKDGGVVAQLLALVVDDGLHQPPQHLGQRLPGPGGPTQVVDQALLAELLPGRRARLHHAVGEEHHGVAGLELG